MNKGFALHDLPDDIVHLLVKEWLTDSDNMGEAEVISIIDIAYCNHSLRPRMLSSIAGIAVSVEESLIKKNLRLLYKWIQDRHLKVREFILDQTKHSESRALTRRERMPPPALLHDVQSMFVGVGYLSDLDHPTVSAMLSEAPAAKKLSLVLNLADESSSKLTGKRSKLLSRVTSLHTKAPQLLNAMQSLPPSLRELKISGHSIFHFLDQSLWQTPMFSLLEKLSLTDLCNCADSWMPAQGDATGHRGYAHLPNLTHLTISFNSVWVCDVMLLLYRFMTRDAPNLAHVKLIAFRRWDASLCEELFTHAPRHLQSLILQCQFFLLEAAAKTPFPPMQTIAQPADMANSLEVLCLNAVHFVSHAPSVAIDLRLEHASLELMNCFPWQALSTARQLKSLHLHPTDFDCEPHVWVEMLLAPTHSLTLDFNLDKDDREEDVDAVVEGLTMLRHSERKSTVRVLDWLVTDECGDAITDFTDYPHAQTLSEASINAMISAFPDVVHVGCTLSSVTDQHFVSCLENWPEVRKLAIRSSLKLTLSSISHRTWRSLLSQTRCRSYTVFDCESVSVDAYFTFARELRKTRTKVKDWKVVWTNNQDRSLWRGEPGNDKNGKSIEFEFFFPPSDEGLCRVFHMTLDGSQELMHFHK